MFFADNDLILTIVNHVSGYDGSNVNILDHELNFETTEFFRDEN